MAKFHMVPIDYNGFGASFTPKTPDVGDVTRTRGGSVYCHGFQAAEKYPRLISIRFIFAFIYKRFIILFSISG